MVKVERWHNHSLCVIVCAVSLIVGLICTSTSSSVWAGVCTCLTCVYLSVVRVAPAGLRLNSQLRLIAYMCRRSGYMIVFMIVLIVVASFVLGHTFVLLGARVCARPQSSAQS